MCNVPQHRRQHADARGAARLRRRTRGRPIRRKPAAAAARATACRSTISRCAVSCITWCWPRRCAPARCAASARCRTCSRSSASWTSWPSAPGSIRWRTGCRMLSDPRARRIIEDVAARSDWARRGPAGTGHGLGLGWARYKNKAAYAAVAVELEVDQEVRLQRVWCAADAGLVINPDGGKNQLEGGIIQAASMTLKEQVTMEGEGVTSVDWKSYPILKFSEVPEIETDWWTRRTSRRWGWANAPWGRQRRRSATRWRTRSGCGFGTCRSRGSGSRGCCWGRWCYRSCRQHRRSQFRAFDSQWETQTACSRSWPVSCWLAWPGYGLVSHLLRACRAVKAPVQGRRSLIWSTDCNRQRTGLSYWIWRSAVVFANGGYQVSYEEVEAVQHSHNGDPVFMCLIRIPRNCPPGDARGRWYTTTNLRTMESWTMMDWNMDVGAPDRHRCRR